MKGVSGLIQVGVDILKSTVASKTKRILLQVGDVVNQVSDSDNVEYWQHVGFRSRPPKPDAGKTATQGVLVRRGDYDVVICTQDDRGADLEDLEDGDTMIYAPGPTGAGKARILLKGDGTIKAKNGTTTITVSPEGDVTLDAPKSFSVSTLSAALDAGKVDLGKAPATGVLTLQTAAPMWAAFSVWAAAVSNAIAALVPLTGIADPTGALVSTPNTALGALTPLLVSPATYTKTVKAGP